MAESTRLINSDNKDQPNSRPVTNLFEFVDTYLVFSCTYPSNIIKKINSRDNDSGNM